MSKLYLFKSTVLALLSILFAISAQSQEFPKLLLDIEEIELKTGETYQLPSILDYVESETSDTVDANVSWTISPDSLGSLDANALFSAEKPGEGYLYVSYNNVLDSVEIEIETEDDDDMDDYNFPKLLLYLEEIELDTGEIYQLPAVLEYVESGNSDTAEVDVTWTVVPDTLGTLDEFSVFTAKKAGKGYLYVVYENARDSVELEVESEDDDDDSDDYPKVKIIPGSVKVELGDSLELYAFYVDSSDVKMDTTFIWSVEPAELGMFEDPEIPTFKTGEDTGSGIIIAQLGELADTIKIRVYESKWKREKKNNGKQLTILPGDTTIHIDAGMIQYTASYKTNGNKHQDNEYLWSVSDTSIATIDSNGLLTLKGVTGLTLVSAKYSNFKASVELLVSNPAVDMDINSITIHRVLPDGKVLNPKTFNEGESYKIGGLPYPLNILNAGMLHFPYGSISEDITIFMKIPEKYAEIDDEDTEVTFTDDIITGVEFNVQPYASDTIVHPYEFNIPLELKLIYKQGLLDSLKVDPHDLDVFFADNAMFEPVDDGVATVDTAQNRIYASISHFSTIVVRAAESTTLVDELDAKQDNFFKVYPNPFRSYTQIEFYLQNQSDISLSVYNLFGQKVRTLINKELPEGQHKITWNGKDGTGNSISSGIYLLHLSKDNTISDIKRVIINR